MSEDFAPQTDAEPIVDGTPEYTSEVSQDTEIPTLDVSEYADYRIPVKLDGEELQVSLSEAISGYQRQADYTRKTQELAQQREQLAFASNLQSALENDPAATIDLLSRHYGISRAEARDMIDGMDSQYEDLDPTEKKMRELDQRIAQFEDYQSQQQIEREISRLQSKYDDFDTNEVVGAALKANSTDLEAVYKQIAFDRFMKQKELDSLAAQQKQLKESKVVEAKREASVVSGGSSATTSTTSDSAEPIGSISDAWAAAKRQLNANF
jgi:hypothetical protein